MQTARCPSLSDCVDLLLDAICVVDPEGRFLYISAAGEQIFGYKPEEMLGRRMIELVHPDDRDVTLRAVREIMDDNPQPHFENRYIRKDGRTVHIMWSARWSAADGVRIAVARDITARKRAELTQAAFYAMSEAAHSSDDLPGLFEEIQNIIAELLPMQRFCIALWQPGLCQLKLAYDARPAAAAVPASGPDLLQLCESVVREDKALRLPRPADSSEGSWLGVPLKSSSGTVGVMLVQRIADPLAAHDQDHELLQFVSTQIASAIERKQMYERLEYYAYYDALTRLPNRALFHDRIQLALMRARRENSQFAVLFLDLDRFRAVNDGWGHTIGDILLEKVARLLESCVRECDTVARLGGDEFVVLLGHCSSRAQAQQFGAQIAAAFAQPMDVAGISLTVVPSLGLAVFPEDGSDEQQLMRAADQDLLRFRRHS